MALDPDAIPPDDDIRFRLIAIEQSIAVLFAAALGGQLDVIHQQYLAELDSHVDTAGFPDQPDPAERVLRAMLRLTEEARALRRGASAG